MRLGFIFEGKSMIGLSNRVHLKNNDNNNNNKILTWSSSSETTVFFCLPLFVPPPYKYRTEWDGPTLICFREQALSSILGYKGEVWASKKICMLYPSSKFAAAPSHHKTIWYCLRGGGDWHRLYSSKAPSPRPHLKSFKELINTFTFEPLSNLFGQKKAPDFNTY